METMADNFVHESACVDEGVIIGRGTRIWHFSHLLSRTVIGDNCVVGQNVMIGPDVHIGQGCKIQNNVSVYKGVELEEDVFCGPSMVFTNVTIPRAFIDRKAEFKRTLVKRGASIGANATILCGNTIGQYAIVAAGAVVTTNVRAYELVAGVPARHVGWVCRCGNTLKPVGETESATCRFCRRRYNMEADKVLVAQE